MATLTTNKPLTFDPEKVSAWIVHLISQLGISFDITQENFDELADVLSKLEEKTSGSHVFKGENGGTEAHRHQNSDGSFGGWVSDDCTIEEEVYIDPEAEVSGASIIKKGSTIMAGARVIKAILGEETMLNTEAFVLGKDDPASRGRSDVPPGSVIGNGIKVFLDDNGGLNLDSGL